MKRLAKVSSVCSVIAGALIVALGIYGVIFTYKSVVREKITTTQDASIPNASVHGVLTLKSQADIIRTHVLNMSEGKTYAELPLEEGEKRAIWITAMTLITALNLSIMAYILSGFMVIVGIFMVWTGLLFYSLVLQKR